MARLLLKTTIQTIRLLFSRCRFSLYSLGFGTIFLKPFAIFEVNSMISFTDMPRRARTPSGEGHRPTHVSSKILPSTISIKSDKIYCFPLFKKSYSSVKKEGYYMVHKLVGPGL